MKIRIKTGTRPPYRGASMDDSYPVPVRHVPKCVARNRKIFAGSAANLSPWLTSHASKPTPTRHKTRMEFSPIRACCNVGEKAPSVR